jgi:hypothetical protein
MVGRPMVAVFDGDGLRSLAARGITWRVVVADIDALAAAERERLAARKLHAAGAGWYSEYRNVVEVGQRLIDLSKEHPELTGLRTLGGSIEGWPIRALEISRGGDIGIALSGGLHAREWISVMVATCVAERLLESADRDQRVRDILEQVSFSAVPLANPDGYAHSWTVDRYWRKNRRGGYGVDLNRNFSVAWGRSGASSRKRSQTYRGESAFSEPESRALANLFDDRRIRAHIDFHSYSQLILYPWSYQRKPPEDRDELAAIGDRMASAMYAAHGQPYKVLGGADLYGASGTALDWSYGERGALSFVIELRPARGRRGFVLPPEQIVPTCDEGYAATLELAEWMISRRESGRGL